MSHSDRVSCRSLRREQICSRPKNHSALYNLLITPYNMRHNIIKEGDEFLRYEIREIVETAKAIASRGIQMTWENIGDPIAKGEKIPEWMKDIIRETVTDDATFAYAPTKGLVATREFILEHYSCEHVCTIEDIIVFNGLGEAINKIFSNLPKNARVIGPNPTYPSHAIAESMHHGGSHITYSLDPENGWEIDLAELENKVRYNESIVGILVINPNNPTGTVYARETLERIVAIAKQYHCFVIFDEIYQNIVFDASRVTKLCDIIGDVPGISMKGISKEIPWPGARCGWLEVYNADKDDNFRGYINTIVVSKMLEVSSATLPQAVFPRILTDARYRPFFAERIRKYERRADIAVEIFSRSPYLAVTKPDGVFYLTVRYRVPQ